jgi:hypothetical protein
MALTRAAAVMSAYYGLASASMSDMVRDIVYGDTTESWFSPAGWYRDGKYGREIHPGSTGHQTMTYALAYNLLNLVSTRCNMVEYEVAPGSQGFRQTVAEQLPYDYSAERQPALLGGKARPTPRYSLPPRLTKSLALHNVSQLWAEEEFNTTQVLEASRGTGGGTGGSTKTTQCYSARCPFAWVQGTAEEFFKLPPGLEGYFAPVTKEMTNWTLEKGKKSGFVPAYGTDPADNRLVWEFASLQQPIRSVTLFFMKSYGEKWDNSVVRMDVYQNPVSEPSTEVSSSSLVKLSKGRRRRRRLQALRPSHNVTHTNVTTRTTTAEVSSRRKLELSSSSPILISKELDGFHAKKTSETYSETVEFPTSLSVGDTLRLQFTLLRGNSFKIMGIIVCS